MSIGGEMWEEVIWEMREDLKKFLLILEEAAKQENKEGEEAAYWLDKFKKHFNL